MKKAMCILSFIFIALMLCTAAYAAAEPVITANGMSGTVNVAADSAVTVRIQLSPGDKEGTDADWWLVCNAFGKWYYYTLDGNWHDIGYPSDIGKLSPTYQGKLAALPSSEILNIPKLPAGAYNLYFGVDTDMNGRLDTDSLVFGEVRITKRDEFVSATSFGDVHAGYNIPGYALTAVNPNFSDSNWAAEESDIIKLDGTYLYLLNRFKGLTICDISKPDSPVIAGQMPVTIKPVDMHIRDNKAYIIVSAGEQTTYRFIEYGLSSSLISDRGSRILIADIADKTNPKSAGSFDLTGTVQHSRLVGNILYVVAMETTSSPEMIRRNTYVASLDISDANHIREIGRENFGDRVQNIHISDQAIFIATSTDYVYHHATISYLDISDPGGRITKRGNISVDADMDKYSDMDYYNGYLRVRTCQSKTNSLEGGTYTMFVFDTNDPDQPKLAGSVNLGEGSLSLSAYFDGNRAYMPNLNNAQLSVIDLSDPANPALKGELTVPGRLGYITPKGNRLIAMGSNDSDGWETSVYLIDVSKPENPALIKSVSFTDKNSGWNGSANPFPSVETPIISDDMGLILLPYRISGHPYGVYRYENRLQLIDYSADDLNTRGWVSGKKDVMQRLGVSDRLFSVSNDELQVIDTDDRDSPKVTAVLSLAVKIADFIPLDNGYGVQIIENAEKYTLRAVPLAAPETGSAVSETDIDLSFRTGTFSNGNMIYFISAGYESKYETDGVYDTPPNWKTRIQVVDFSIPANPVKRGTMDMEGYHYQPMKSDMPLYSYSDQERILQVKGSILIFSRAKGFNIVDLSDADHPKLLSESEMGITGVTGSFVNGSTLYVTTVRSIGSDEKNRPLSAYYLSRIDLSDPSKPLQLPAVNIPGTCIGTDSSGMYVYTVNSAYTSPPPDAMIVWYHTYTFNALKLDQDKAYLTDSATLGNYFGQAVAADGFFYLNTLTGITAVDVSNPEKPKVYENTLKDTWIYGISDAKKGKIFAHTVGGMACYDASDPANLTLNEFTGHYGYNHAAFSDSKAYLPMGYNGLWVKKP